LMFNILLVVSLGKALKWDASIFEKLRLVVTGGSLTQRLIRFLRCFLVEVL